MKDTGKSIFFVDLESPKYIHWEKCDKCKLLNVFFRGMAGVRHPHRNHYRHYTLHLRNLTHKCIRI